MKGSEKKSTHHRIHPNDPQFNVEYVEGMSDQEMMEFLDYLEDTCWQKANELERMENDKDF